MAKFILKRILYMLVVLFCVVTLTFFLVHSIPGDPITCAGPAYGDPGSVFAEIRL